MARLPEHTEFSCDHSRIMRGTDRNQLGRRIEMAERTAYGAAVARLPMADVHDGLMQQRAFRRDQVREFEIALASHGADFESAAGFLDAGDALDADSSEGLVQRRLMFTKLSKHIVSRLIQNVNCIAREGVIYFCGRWRQ